MRLVNVGVAGEFREGEAVSWDALAPWGADVKLAGILASGRGPRPLQVNAIRRGLVSSRRNVLVSAPTNSGKTLLGYLTLLDAIGRGGRAILLEPLRALAREKADELERVVGTISKAIGRTFMVRISTGDYRLESETYADPAPFAELVIATPERLESILRRSDNQAWFADLGAVCVDEAHLLADPRRGATLEYLITSLLTLPAPPRLVLLSATMGGAEQVAEWLHPCDVISIAERTPPLEKWLAELAEGDDADDCAAQWLEGELAKPGTQALVFIHQARHTAGTAQRLTQALRELAGTAGAQPYNSQMPPAKRDLVRGQFVSGASRIMVTTSALAMGVNLPATHVVVRDLTYIGARSPGVGEVLQMMGRAGRGEQAGKALVIRRPTDAWATVELVSALREERLPPLSSALAVSHRAHAPGEPPPAAEAVASLLLRAGDAGKSTAELESFFNRSLGGRAIAPQVGHSLKWLQCEMLAYADEIRGTTKLTRLGAAAVRAVLPLRIGGGFGRLIRDLLSLGEDDETLGRWTPLDFLIALELLHEDTPALRRFGAGLTDQVVSWCEGDPQQVPMLFRRWLCGTEGYSRAAEVLGSLGVEPRARTPDRDEWARQRGYLATFNAIVLHERSMGRSVIDLERQYGITNLEGVEERWRDTMIWLLAGVATVLDVKCFFFHLKEDCAASDTRIKTVKRYLAQMRVVALELIEQLKYASPLGGMLLAMKRRGQTGVGTETLRKLEGMGVTRSDQLGGVGLEGLVAAGVRRSIAKKLLTQAKRNWV